MLQAEVREKERLKEENRRSKKLESGFRNLLRAKELDHLVSWEDSKSRLEGDPAFESIADTLVTPGIALMKSATSEAVISSLCPTRINP